MPRLRHRWPPAQRVDRLSGPFDKEEKSKASCWSPPVIIIQKDIPTDSQAQTGKRDAGEAVAVGLCSAAKKRKRRARTRETR